MGEGSRAAVFLDRDGTIIEDRDFLGDPTGVRLLPGAAEAILRLNRAGLPVVIVTNQSGIGRGYFGPEEYAAVEVRIEEELRKHGAKVEATYHCPHAPDESPPCDCRKPLPGLFQRAASELDLDPARSFFIGDRLRDVLPGLQLGGTGYLLDPAHPDESAAVPPAVVRVESLARAVDHLLTTWGSD